MSGNGEEPAGAGTDGKAGSGGAAQEAPRATPREAERTAAGEAEPAGWEGFRRSTWGLVLAITIAVVFDIFLLMFRTCLTGALIAVVTFGLPFYFNMRRPRDLLIMGTAVLLFLSVFSPVFIHLTNEPNPTTPVSHSVIANLTSSHVAASDGESVNITLEVNRTAGWTLPVVYLRVDALSNWLQFFWPDDGASEGNFTMVRGRDYAYDSSSKSWRLAHYDEMTGGCVYADDGLNATGRVVTRFRLDRTMAAGDYQFSALAVQRNEGANLTLRSEASVADDESVFVYKLFPWFILTYVISTFIDTSLFYILVGMSWWLKRTKELTGGLVEAPRKDGAPKPEFTCSDCGGDVYASEQNCPHCGAKLED